MKAVYIEKYGSPDAVQLREVDKPVPKENEVLVKVKAASVNYNTVMFITGKPFIGRMFTGLLKPKIKTPGNDVAGIVESVGEKVTQFQHGDEVFGDTADIIFRTLAEYVSVPDTALTPKPANLTFEEAAAVPEAALVALQSLRDIGQIKKDEKVLIIGASGGIGTFAVQFARYFGAEVTGLCGTRNMDMVSSLGADHVIDYTKEDFTKSGNMYDLILATAGYRWIMDFKRILKSGGRYVVTGGSMKQIFQASILGPFISSGSKKFQSMVVKPNKDLEFVKELIEKGQIKPVIDKIYTLNESAKAIKHYDTGHARGKIIITM